MVYLIMGRTGSGKDYMNNLLREKGLTSVLSYTTRPKRTENEDTHIFLTEDEEKEEKYADRVAETKINDYVYFATRDQVENADIYIIDPNGAKELIENMPDTAFHIVYISVKDESKRQLKVIERVEADKKIQEAEVFIKRSESENAQFSEFEDYLEAKKNHEETNSIFDSNNVTAFHIFNNNYDEEKAKIFATKLYEMKTMHNNIERFVEAAIEEDMVDLDENDTNKVKVTYSDEKSETGFSTKPVAKDIFVDEILNSEEGFFRITQGVIAKRNVNIL